MAADSSFPSQSIFRELHADLPRQGPGDRDSTARALACVSRLPPAPEILDIGCGPGMQTLDLARLCPDARITAVDVHVPFLDALADRAEKAGMNGRITVLRGDMRKLPFEPGSFHLLWCEGAAYIMGVEAALKAWRPLLKRDGCIAFTDAVWLGGDRPAELRDWWRSGYPGMTDIGGCIERVQAAGYAALEHFVLPESAWWNDYYGPMAERIERLQASYAGDASAEAVLDGCRREIDYYRRWSAHYGYLFVIARMGAATRVKETR